MQILLEKRWLFTYFLLISTCLQIANCKGGRGGGGSRGGGSRGSRPSYSRPSPSRPAPAPAYRPRPAPAPAPAYKPPPAPAPAPAYKPPEFSAPKPAYNPPKPVEPSYGRQPAYNPNFKEPSIGERQPAYNPNVKLDGSRPAGPPPPYSPAGNPVPNAPVGPPPPYQPSFGNPQPGLQPPPYPGQPNVRPPGYPGIGAPYQPGGSAPNLQGVNRPYPVQPNYPGSNVNRPYPVQPNSPGSFQGSSVNRPYPVQPNYPGSFQGSGVNRPYPVQPGLQNPYPGVNRPYPQQSLGSNVWQPHYGVPAPAYMNYGGIPTGANMYQKPHKQKGFLGSLMSMGKSKPKIKNKYYGSYPSPYGVGHSNAGGFLGKHGSSAAMYTIFPYMAAKSVKKMHKPRYTFMPIFMPRSPYYHHHHHHYGHSGFGVNDERASYYNIFDDDYAGRCQQPIKKENREIKCKFTFDDVKCDARCEEGYKFPHGIELLTNKCWHVTGVWRPKKNFPECSPVCADECLNGGTCIRPGVCKCTTEYRGDRCQLHFLKCDILDLVKEEKVGWVCNHSKNESICKISCKEPKEFESPPAAEYKCTPDGVWQPDKLPRCVIKEDKDLTEILLDL